MKAAEIDALVAAARQAGRKEIMPRFQGLSGDMIASKSEDHDLVTVADKRAEELLAKAAKAIFPDALIIGEEAAADTPNLLSYIDKAPRAVIIDPIDGTWNYANGTAMFGTILAVVENGETVFGLIYDPVTDHWIAAERGAGCWEGHARAPIWQSPIAPGHSGFVPTYLFEQQIQERLYPQLAKFERVTALRCSAHEYRLVAQRSMAFCLAASLKPWDHAAGALIVEESGGVARLLGGQPYRPGIYEGQLLTAIDAAHFDAARDVLAPVFQ